MKLKLSPDILALNPGLAQAITVDGDKAAQKQARVPRAGTEPATGLTALVAERGWSVDANDHRFRLYQLHTGLDTGYCADEKAACDRAKELERGHHPAT